MLRRRSTSESELAEIIEYWDSLGRASNYVDKGSLISFLQGFTSDQIKGAMYVAQSFGRGAYFRYLCGILLNWRRELEVGREPNYLEVEG